MSRETQIDREALSLWHALRDTPPPSGLRGSDLLSLLIGQAGAPAYERLHSPHLRDSQITRPPPGPRTGPGLPRSPPRAHQKQFKTTL